MRLTVQRKVDSRLDDVALELGAFHLPAELESIQLTLTQLLALNLLSLYPIPFLADLVWFSRISPERGFRRPF